MTQSKAYLLSLLILIIQPVYGAGFDKVESFILAGWRDSAMDWEVEGTSITILVEFSYPMMEAYGYKVHVYSLDKLPNTLEELDVPPSEYRPYHFPPIFQLDYLDRIYGFEVIEPAKKLRGHLIRIGSIIHAPDYDDHSHQFSLDGRYLGRLPNFYSQYRQHRIEQGRPILEWDGKPIEAPFTFQGVRYDSITELEDTLLLVTDRQITAVGIQDLLARKENAPAHSIFLPTNDFFVVNHVKRNFFLMSQKLYSANPGEAIVEIPLKTPPSFTYSPYSKVDGDFYYQVEYWGGWNQLTQYRMFGIQGLSGLEIGKWEGLE